MNILLADDNDSDVYLLQEALKSIAAAANLTRVRDGQEMMTLCTSPDFDRFDLVIVDYYLPKRSGREVIETIAARDGTIRPPAVIFTSDLSREESDKLLQRGAMMVIKKPIDFAELCETAKQFEKLAEGHRQSKHR